MTPGSAKKNSASNNIGLPKASLDYKEYPQFHNLNNKYE